MDNGWNSDGTYAHHNWVENGNGIAEGSNGTGKNITISYNVLIENGGFFALHTNNFTVDNCYCSVSQLS